MTWVLNHLMWYFHFKVQIRPQVKLAPGQICPSQIDTKSNRPQIKSYMVYLQPLEFRPHSYFIDFTLHVLFYIMMSLPAFVKVGKTLDILEKQAVNMFILAFLWTVDFFQLLTFCDLKKIRIQKLLYRVEKYRWLFVWTTRHKGKWFFFNIFH